MGVLTRRVGDSVMIGDDVVVTVVAIREDTVRLGITAPRDCHIEAERSAREHDPTQRFLNRE